jgi:hypothetical protein
LVLGSLSHEEWLLSTWSPERLHVLEALLAWIDAIAIILVLLLLLARACSQRALDRSSGLH